MIKKIQRKIDREIYIILAVCVAFFYKIFLFSQKIIYPAGDLIEEYYGEKVFFVKSVLVSHVFPLWNPLKFSGISYIADPQAAIFTPLNLLYLIFPTPFAFELNFFIDTFLAGLFTYLFAKLIKISKFGSFIAAIVMIFGGTFIIKIFSFHIYILNAIALFPLLLYFFEKFIQNKKLVYAIFTGILLSLMTVTGNIQIAFYSLTAILLYFLIRLIVLKSLWKVENLLFLIITGVISFFLLAVELFPIIEFSSFTSRAVGVLYSFGTDFSLNPKQLISFILPQFFGTPLSNSYWGTGNFSELSMYMGMLPLFFVIIAIFKKRIIYVYTFTFLLFFSLFFAFGKNFVIFPIFFKFIPFFNSFRVPARFLFIFGFSIAVLSGFGIDSFFNFKKASKIFSYSFLFLGLVLLFISVYLKILPSGARIFSKLILRGVYAVGVNRTLIFSNVVQDLFVLSVMILVISVLLFLKNRKTSPLIIKLLITIVILGNLFFYYLNFYQMENVNQAFKQINEVEQIKKDKTTFRVFDQSGLLVKNLSLANIESITGSGPEISWEYRKFLWQVGDHSDRPFDGYIDITKIKDFWNLRLLNVKYLVSKSEVSNPELKLVMKADKFYLYQMSPLPRAFFAKDLSLNSLKAGKYQAVEVKSGINSINTSSFNSNKGFLVLSQPYYPGWKAFDQGKELKVTKSLGILDVVELNAGEHKINFVFQPLSFEIGGYISAITVVVLIGILLYIQKKKES